MRQEISNEHSPENSIRPSHHDRRARRRHAGRVAARTAGACTSTRAAAAGQGARGAQAAPVTAVERTTTMRMTASGTRPAPFSFGADGNGSRRWEFLPRTPPAGSTRTPCAGARHGAAPAPSSIRSAHPAQPLTGLPAGGPRAPGSVSLPTRPGRLGKVCNLHHFRPVRTAAGQKDRFDTFPRPGCTQIEPKSA